MTAMDSGKVLHACHEGVHVLRFIGDIRYNLSPSVERFLEGVYAGPLPAGFVIDLSETDSIDSTNLGLLVQIARWMQVHDAPRVTIVSVRDDINDLLTSMAFDEVFDIVTRTSMQTGNERELPPGNTDKAALAHTLLEAHRALMELSERNQEMFHDVVTALEKNAAKG
jgi:anti-anti-sigma factor